MKISFCVILLLFWVNLSLAGNDFPATTYPLLDLTSDLKSIQPDSDDPFSYPDTFKPKNISISQFSWVTTGNLPPEVQSQRSNNNVSITIFENRLFLAYRTSLTHFASKKTKLYVISSLNGIDWEFEAEVSNQTDLREPQLMVLDHQLHFFFFEGGSNPFKFKPTQMLKLTRLAPGVWTNPVPFLEKGEVPWEMKTRKAVNYLSSYSGPHYNLTGKSNLNVMFKKIVNGDVFLSADETARTSVVYNGGVSETGWEFDTDGNLWAVLRNEDGDENGFGSQLMFAPKDKLNKWQKMGPIDRNCYMSPKMFRVGKELYLIGRKQLGKKPFGRTSFEAPMVWQRLNNWIPHSLTPKGTGLYRINRTTNKIDFVMDLPGHGDTAFPSVYRLSEKEFLISNYTSPLHKPKRSWLNGQLKPTQVYLMKLKFK